MPQIIPIRDLKNTSAISEKCRLSDTPIFITKNGYGDMVIMSMKRYEESLAKLDVYAKLADAEQQVQQGLSKEATKGRVELSMFNSQLSI